MAEIRTPDVDDLLCVLAAIDDPDTIFALLEDLFTVPRDPRDVPAIGRGAASGGGEVLRGHRGRDGSLGHDHRPGFQMPELRCRRL